MSASDVFVSTEEAVSILREKGFNTEILDGKISYSKQGFLVGYLCIHTGYGEGIDSIALDRVIH